MKMSEQLEQKLHKEGKLLFLNKEYIAEFVYGGIDGAITTFAVVSGAAGANADIVWVLIFGFANLIADGFSMSVGNFFSVKSERERYERHRSVEYWEVENLRQKEVEEIREIYTAKGFQGELLEKVVEVITRDKDIWVDTMMKEELELVKEDKKPVNTALVTFVSFIIVGFIPMISYVVAALSGTTSDHLFLISCISTGLALVLIGLMKSKVNETPSLRSISETLLLGGLAATLAYFAGVVLGDWLL